MTSRSMFRLALTLLALAIVTSARVGSQSASKTLAADAASGGPSHQVIACYFHRTQRCPTCQKISAYIEESIKAGFAEQLKEKSVRMVMMDFQDPKNRKYTEAYEIDGPTLVLMDVRDGKIVSWKAAPKVWSLVGRKDDFFRYVQREIQDYLVGSRTASR